MHLTKTERPIVASVVGAVIALLVGCVGDDPGTNTATSPDGGGGTEDSGGGNNNTDSSATGDSSGSSDSSGACTPGCSGTSLVTCQDDGKPVVKTCALGCIGGGAGDRCKQAVPSGAASGGVLDTASKALTVLGSTTVTFNTVNGAINEGVTSIRAAGPNVVNDIGFAEIDPGGGKPKIGVFSLNSLDIQVLGKVVFTGANAVAIYTSGSLSVHGSISVRGDCSAINTPGSGGYAGTTTDGLGPSGGKKGVGSSGAAGGGGGAGGATAGGLGAQYPNGGGAGVIGEDFLSNPTLRGGGGGGGGLNAGTDGVGGSGGGALQIVTSGTALISGTIDAGGCHGRKVIAYVGGGGGGAGGLIVIEAAMIQVDPSARVVANGGGGGGEQADAQDGTLDATPANGGTCATSPGGGKGGALGVAPQDGNCGGPGGGGGAAGRIAVKSKGAQLTIPVGAIFSPTASAGEILAK